MGVEYYTTHTGTSPFSEWFRTLERERRAAVVLYIDRVSRGGSRKSVVSLGDGVWEIKIPYKATRVYFGKNNGLLVLLGGGKSRQSKDIKRAKYYWSCYVEEKHVLQQNGRRADARP